MPAYSYALGEEAVRVFALLSAKRRGKVREITKDGATCTPYAKLRSAR